MQTINLKDLISNQGLDKKEIARQLFPKNKYPDLALNRVLSGEAVLDSDQISKLALLSGVSISDLFSESKWNATSSDGKHVFINDEFRAELNTETWVTKIFHNESLFHDSIIHSGSTPMGEYFNALNLIIYKYKNNE